jgi:hypothetical protein
MAHLKPFFAIKPIHTLMVHCPTLTLKQGVYPLVSIAHSDGCNLSDPLSKNGLLIFQGAII